MKGMHFSSKNARLLNLKDWAQVTLISFIRDEYPYEFFVILERT